MTQWQMKGRRVQGGDLKCEHVQTKLKKEGKPFSFNNHVEVLGP